MTTAAPTTSSPLEAIRQRAAELAQRAHWSPDELHGHRQKQLRNLVAHAVEHSPYYRETLGTDAAEGELVLEQLPTLPKRTLMEEFDRIVTEPELRLADLEAHLAGPDAGVSFGGRHRVFATSGSSGLRGVFVHSEDEFTTWIAAHLPVFARVGIGPETRLVALGAPSPVHLSKQLFAVFQERSGAPRLTVTTPLREAIETLHAFRPEAVIGYASVIATLAQEQLDGRLRIEPQIVMTGAELLTTEMRHRIESAWGVSPGQAYATTEVPLIAASVEPGGALQVLDDLVWIEVVDEQNRPVPVGTPGYRVLLTNLVNRAQPLIRYELTDSVTLAEKGLIASIDGRSDDILRLPGRSGGEVAVHPLRLRSPFATLPDVATYQIGYDGQALCVRVVLRPEGGPETLERVRNALLAALAEAGAVLPVRVEAVDAIEREGHAAKLKLVRTTLA